MLRYVSDYDLKAVVTDAFIKYLGQLDLFEIMPDSFYDTVSDDDDAFACVYFHDLTELCQKYLERAHL